MEFTLARTIAGLVGAALMPVYAKFKFSIKKIMLFGTTASGLAAIGYSFGTNIWHFYAVAIFHGMFVNASNFMMLGILIGRWFKDKRGLAMGVPFYGLAVAGVVVTLCLIGVNLTGKKPA